MSSLYSVTRNQEAVGHLFQATHDCTGNLPPLPAIFPDMIAAVVRGTAGGERELVMLRWGMPPAYVCGVDRGVTNIRNVSSPRWRLWLGPANRCVVPAVSFCEPSRKPDPATGKRVWTWFALGRDPPLFCFAGI